MRSRGSCPIPLQTHNVAMTSPISDFVVSLGSDGRILSQGTMSKALATSKALTRELKAGELELHKAEEAVDGEIPEVHEGKSGKLMVAEEVAEGHVSWPACESPHSSHKTPLMNPSKTVLHWDGGLPPAIFLVHGCGQFDTYRGFACRPDPVLGYPLTVRLLTPALTVTQVSGPLNTTTMTLPRSLLSNTS